MSSEKVIHLAKFVDIDAMIALGTQFFEENKISDSAKWFGLAANSSNATEYAVIRAIQTGSVVARSLQDVQKWKESYSEWDKVHHWCISIFEKQIENEEYKSIAMDYLISSLYGLGYTLYRMNLIDVAIKRLRVGLDFNNDDISLLYGACLIESDQFKENPSSEIHKAYPYLKIAETTKTNVAEDIIYQILMVLAFAYRTNEISDIKTDIEAAYHCVEKAAALPGNLGETAKQELSKYKKGLFGGIVYKG